MSSLKLELNLAAAEAFIRKVKPDYALPTDPVERDAHIIGFLRALQKLRPRDRSIVVKALGLFGTATPVSRIRVLALSRVRIVSVGPYAGSKAGYPSKLVNRRYISTGRVRQMFKTGVAQMRGWVFREVLRTDLSIRGM